MWGPTSEPGVRGTGEDPASSDDGGPTFDEDDPRVLLFMRPGRDRELLAETLGERYRVATTTDVDTLDVAFDCCVFDAPEFHRVAGTVQQRRDTSESVFLPFVLLAGSDVADGDLSGAWEYVDDLIRLPVDRSELLSRVGNLVERRRTAARLAEREAQLERTVEDLELKERAMDAAPVGITITDPDREDNPMIYLNEEFEALTGYGSRVIGENCRILQGEDTDPAARATLREAIEAGEEAGVDILNYRADGRRFWNDVRIAPIRDEDDRVSHFVGFQTDITERKVRERRLEVLNRVLSHNLRNKMNVVEGYTELLRAEFDDREDEPAAFDEIGTAVSELTTLADAARTVEHVTSESRTGGAVALDRRLSELVSSVRDSYPDASVDLTFVGDGPYEVAGVGLSAAVEEAVENAVEHNDSEYPSVEITVERRPDGWIEVEVRDDGPGIPEEEVRVLREGETPLSHAERMGLWLIHWVVSLAGGEFTVESGDPRGTVVSISVPPADGAE